MLRLDERDGRRTLLDGAGRSVHSTYNPEAEGERQAAALELAAETLLFVVGPGLGHMLAPLAGRADCRVAAVEYPEFLPHPPAGVVVQSPVLAEFPLADWQPERYRHIRVARGPAYRHDPAYAAAEQRLQAAVDRWAGEKVTTTAFSGLWLRNFATQLGLNPALRAWRPVRASGHTAVIVAAGPSLDAAGAALRQFRGPVWAVDTAWPVLLRLGCVPELVVSNDPQAISRRHFIGWETSAENVGSGRAGSRKATLLTSLTADPGVARLFARRLYYDDGYPLNRFFPELGEFLPAFSHAGGSAAMILYQLAVLCGAKRVVMIGQDLAYPLAGGSHAAGTVYEESALRRVHRFSPLETGARSGVAAEKRDTKTAAGISGPVAVTAPMEQYRLWLERFIAEHPETDFANTATLGMPIAGTGWVEVAQALAEADGITLATAGDVRLDRATGVAKLRALPPDAPWFAELPDRLKTLAVLEKK